MQLDRLSVENKAGTKIRLSAQRLLRLGDRRSLRLVIMDRNPPECLAWNKEAIPPAEIAMMGVTM